MQEIYYINTASHELTQTPAVLDYCDLFQKHPEQRDVMIDSIKRNAIRLQRLTEDMLDITKIKNKTLKPYKEELDLSILLSAIVNDNKNNIENKRIGDIRFLNNETDKKHYIINADSQRITQVVTNLPNNAVIY